MTNHRRKAVAYLRISDKKQDGNHSLDIQRRQIELLAAKENLEIVYWRTDIAKSAYRMSASKRPGLQQVIADIEEGGIEAVCFYEESRVTRSITDFYYEFYLPIKGQFSNTAFYSTQNDGEWDPNNPIVQAKLIFAAEESEIKSIRAKDTQTTILSRDKITRPGAPPPVGYDTIAGYLVPNDEAAIVVLIFDLAKWGHSEEQIAEFLNKCEIKTQKIRHWNHSTIGYILNNSAYGGHLRWDARTSRNNGDRQMNKDYKLYPNLHQRIVDEATIKLVHQIRELKCQHGKMKTSFYLKDILVCNNCGKHLSTKNNTPKNSKKNYLVYKCNHCKKSIDATKVHDSVFENLLSKWISQLDNLTKESRKSLFSWKKKLIISKKKIDSLFGQVQLNERTLSNMISKDSELSESFKFTKGYFQSEKDYMNNAINEIETLLKEQNIFNFLKDLKTSKFSTLSDVEKRSLSLILFNSVRIDFDNEQIEEIDYRYSPFVNFEQAIGCITEEIDIFFESTGWNIEDLPS